MLSKRAKRKFSHHYASKTEDLGPRTSSCTKGACHGASHKLPGVVPRTSSCTKGLLRLRLRIFLRVLLLIFLPLLLFRLLLFRINLGFFTNDWCINLGDASETPDLVRSNAQQTRCNQRLGAHGSSLPAAAAAAAGREEPWAPSL